MTGIYLESYLGNDRVVIVDARAGKRWMITRQEWLDMAHLPDARRRARLRALVAITPAPQTAPPPGNQPC